MCVHFYYWGWINFYSLIEAHKVTQSCQSERWRFVEHLSGPGCWGGSRIREPAACSLRMYFHKWVLSPLLAWIWRDFSQTGIKINVSVFFYFFCCCCLFSCFFPLHISFSPDKRFWHVWSKCMTEYKEDTGGGKKPKKNKTFFQRCSRWVQFAFVDSSQETVCVWPNVESQLSLNS